MESLRDEWAPDLDFDQHHKYLEKGIDVIKENLLVPGDRRFELAYALLVSGRGQKSSVLAVGPPASGKTSFGDLLYGVDDRVEMAKDDNDDTLYGYTNPIKAGEIIPGKMVGLRRENPTAYMNELPHLRNTGPVHRLWDADSIMAHGIRVDLRPLSIYATGNFPDGNRVSELDEALRSRLSAELLTGDHDEETAQKIQDYNAVKTKTADSSPILPQSATHLAIQQMIAARYPVNGVDAKNQNNRRNGGYIVDVINRLNASGLVIPVNNADARIGEALHDAARAHLFLEKKEDGSKVTLEEIGRVMAFVLPTVFQLSYVGKNQLAEAKGYHTNHLERAIAIRRLIAHTAFVSLFDPHPMLPQARAQEVEKGMNAFSYANPEAVSFDVDKALFSKKEAAEKIAAEQANGRFKFPWRKSS